MKNEIKRLNENNFKNSKPLLVAKASHLTTGNREVVDLRNVKIPAEFFRKSATFSVTFCKTYKNQ